MFGFSMLMALVFGNFVIGCLSIASACYTWVRSRIFGLGGIVLSVVGLILIAACLWASVEYGTYASEARSSSTDAVRKLIDDSDARTLAALNDSNKQIADQLQQSLKQLQDNQDRVFSDIQSQVAAIQKALTDRSALVAQPRTDVDAPNTAPRRKTKTR
jgi:hypothetical protein